ncbi:hypothetical protein [Streptomyces sp. NPDC001680]
MAVDQLPRGVREFVGYLEGLLARLDQGGGWSGVFWQRDPDGMRACLDGREVPPWDVMEALLEDFAGVYGPAAATAERERARALHRAALTAYDARPGARDALADRLDVMLREQRYAAERQAELTRRLSTPASPEDTESLRLDLAWARDDHTRATARCAELRARLTELDRREVGNVLGVRRAGGSGSVWGEDGEAGAAGRGVTAGAPPRFGGADGGAGGAGEWGASGGVRARFGGASGEGGVGGSEASGGARSRFGGADGDGREAEWGTSAGVSSRFQGADHDRAHRPGSPASGHASPSAESAARPGAGPESWPAGGVSSHTPHAPASDARSVPHVESAVRPEAGPESWPAGGVSSRTLHAPASDAVSAPRTESAVPPEAGPQSWPAAGVPARPLPAPGARSAPQAAPSPHRPVPAVATHAQSSVPAVAPHAEPSVPAAAPQAEPSTPAAAPHADPSTRAAAPHVESSVPAVASQAASPSPRAASQAVASPSAHAASQAPASPSPAPGVGDAEAVAVSSAGAKPRKRRRGSARFAGMAEDTEGGGVAPAQGPAPVVAEVTPRGARFAGGAQSAEPVAVPVEVVDVEAEAAVAGVVERLAWLRREGRSGEAHALLVEVAQWAPGRFPLLADALHRAGLGADWATLLWEAASLSAERLVGVADALAAAGRDTDGAQLLRQGVARPAEQIGAAVLRLEEEGRGREAGALLDACVRVRTAEEAARSVVADPRRLVPPLLRAAQAVSDERYWDLVHALRVAGHAT